MEGSLDGIPLTLGTKETDGDPDGASDGSKDGANDRVGDPDGTLEGSKDGADDRLGEAETVGAEDGLAVAYEIISMALI
jgi:hypothetical protein